ncbi:unnamed protein product [Cyclocybe aegerita]|uniref:Uncharacterized protein n=1 Tax=Cyclocybe aegerita TaxID=1973307 RepID=A0A8S0VSQ0_CYCAE|nr:unnamed protein product [Cyclocybe aegerita]
MSNEPSAKKHRGRLRSGIPGGEVIGLYENVLHVQEMLKKMQPIADGGEGADGNNEDLIPVDDVADMVGEIVKLLATKVHSRPAFALSGLQQAQIEALHLTEGPVLRLKVNPERMEHERAHGADQLWSDATFYRHLCILHSSVTRTEPSARTFIDAFFFRAAAIFSSRNSEGKRLILGLELPVSTPVGNDKATLNGFVDYAIIPTRDELAASFMRDPLLRKIRLHSDYVLFITEAKAVDVSLGHQLPQALGEMYACSEALDKKMIRGALTNGRSWLFLLVKLDGEGGTYRVSHEISIMAPGPDFSLEVNPASCAQVSIILASWIENSFTDLDSGDWFEC